MDGSGVAWIVGAYVVGSFPSTWLAARSGRSLEMHEAVQRDVGEADAHLMATKHLGWAWGTAAATVDVLKGLLWLLAARRLGSQGDGVLAATGVAAVAGHAFPVLARRFAGRGLATSAGVYLVLLPLQMVIAGVLILAGIALRVGGLASTIAMASVAPVAAVQGQPGAFVAMAAAIFAMIIVRRLEGVRAVIRSGVTPARAVIYRCLFDASASPTSGRRAER